MEIIPFLDLKQPYLELKEELMPLTASDEFRVVYTRQELKLRAEFADMPCQICIGVGNGLDAFI